MPETLSGAPPPFFIRLFTQVATGLHYVESVGAVVVLWLWPSLAPEPRIHQFISTIPVHHKHHRHHHHRCVSHRPDGDVMESQSDPTSTMASEASSPTLEALERVDQAIYQEQERQEQKSDTTPQTVRWRVEQRKIDEEDTVLEERLPSIVVPTTELPYC